MVVLVAVREAEPLLQDRHVARSIRLVQIRTTVKLCPQYILPIPYIGSNFHIGRSTKIGQNVRNRQYLSI